MSTSASRDSVAVALPRASAPQPPSAGSHSSGARRAALGDYGELLASRYLRDHGYDVLATKWRCRDGEVDIVATDGATVVIVEVKTRRHQLFGHPREAITLRKLARLRRLAAMWVRHQDRSFDDVRIDVITVLRPPTGAATLEHLRGVG
jgi:putative endonuclease